MGIFNSTDKKQNKMLKLSDKFKVSDNMKEVYDIISKKQSFSAKEESLFIKDIKKMLSQHSGAVEGVKYRDKESNFNNEVKSFTKDAWNALTASKGNLIKTTISTAAFTLKAPFRVASFKFTGGSYNEKDLARDSDNLKSLKEYYTKVLDFGMKTKNDGIAMQAKNMLNSIEGSIIIVNTRKEEAELNKVNVKAGKRYSMFSNPKAALAGAAIATGGVAASGSSGASGAYGGIVPSQSSDAASTGLAVAGGAGAAVGAKSLYSLGARAIPAMVTNPWGAAIVGVGALGTLAYHRGKNLSEDKMATLAVTDPEAADIDPSTYEAIERMSNKQDVGNAREKQIAKSTNEVEDLQYIKFENSSVASGWYNLTKQLRLNFSKFSKEFYSQNKMKVMVTSTYRSPEKQKAMYDLWMSDREAAKKQGIVYEPAKNSPHSSGKAIDISTNCANTSGLDTLLSKYGLQRPVKKDIVHITVSGVSAGDIKVDEENINEGSTTDYYEDPYYERINKSLKLGGTGNIGASSSISSTKVKDINVFSNDKKEEFNTNKKRKESITAAVASSNSGEPSKTGKSSADDGLDPVNTDELKDGVSYVDNGKKRQKTESEKAEDAAWTKQQLDEERQFRNGGNTDSVSGGNYTPGKKNTQVSSSAPSNIASTVPSSNDKSEKFSKSSVISDERYNKLTPEEQKDYDKYTMSADGEMVLKEVPSPSPSTTSVTPPAVPASYDGAPVSGGDSAPAATSSAAPQPAGSSGEAGAEKKDDSIKVFEYKNNDATKIHQQ